MSARLGDRVTLKPPQGVAAFLPMMPEGTVIKVNRVLGLTADDAWSCYGAGPTRCGECPSCLSADEAWAR